MSESDFRVRQLDHVELFVPDPYEAASWYRRVLGLRIVSAFEHWAATGPLMVESAEAGTKLALFRGEPVGKRPTAGFHRVAFRVDGAGFLRFLDRLTELDLVDDRGEPVMPTSFIDHGGALSVYFVDPWGHRFEITTYEPGVASPPTAGADDVVTG